MTVMGQAGDGRTKGFRQIMPILRKAAGEIEAEE
jgi:ABC-type uncharacterized transport system ATPase subunit